MSAHVLLNLLNKLRKRDKMRGLQSKNITFPTSLTNSKNTGARMLNSIDHVTLKLLKSYFWRDNVKILPSFTQRCNGRHYDL